MRMLKWISRNIWKDKIQNEEIYLKIGIVLQMVLTYSTESE